MLYVKGNPDGSWDIKDEKDNVIANEKTNSEAWRTMERLELREPGRKGKLYQSDSATVKR